MPVDATHPLADRLNKRIGVAIRRSRDSRGLSQIELAERVGVSMQTISNVERGGGASIAVLAVIADTLEVELAELVGTAQRQDFDDAQIEQVSRAFQRIPRPLREHALGILRALGAHQAGPGPSTGSEERPSKQRRPDDAPTPSRKLNPTRKGTRSSTR